MYNKIIPDEIFINNDTFDKYHLGLFFKKYVLQKEYYPYQFDRWDNKQFYGILDNNKNVIYPKPNGLKTYLSRGLVHKNLFFVTDAFEELRSFYGTLTSEGKIGLNSLYTRLDVYNSTEDVVSYYNKYLTNVYNIFQNIYIDDKIKSEVFNFNTFIPHFIKFLRIILKTNAINRSSFFKSNSVPASTNGLRISLANIKALPDIKTTSNAFMNSPEFKSFVDISSKFGFFVDKNQPWTIVADIESPAMKQYIRRYNIFDTDELFNVFYYRAYKIDIDNLKNILIGFWNSYSSAIVTTNSVKDKLDCKNLFVSSSTLHPITLESFDRYFNINWMIRLYLYTRILEENIKVTQNKFEFLFQEACKVNKIYDLEKATLYINEKVSEILQLSKPEVNTLTNPDAIYTLLTSRSINLPGEDINF